MFIEKRIVLEHGLNALFLDQRGYYRNYVNLNLLEIDAFIFSSSSHNINIVFLTAKLDDLDSRLEFYILAYSASEIVLKGK